MALERRLGLWFAALLNANKNNQKTSANFRHKSATLEIISAVPDHPQIRGKQFVSISEPLIFMGNSKNGVQQRHLWNAIVSKTGNRATGARFRIWLPQFENWSV